MTDKIDTLKSILGRDPILEKDGELVKDTLYPAAGIVQRIAEDCAEESPLASMSGEEIERSIDGQRGEAEKSGSDKSSEGE